MSQHQNTLEFADFSMTSPVQSPVQSPQQFSLYSTVVSPSAPSQIPQVPPPAYSYLPPHSHQQSQQSIYPPLLPKTPSLTPPPPPSSCSQHPPPSNKQAIKKRIEKKLTHDELSYINEEFDLLHRRLDETQSDISSVKGCLTASVCCFVASIGSIVCCGM